MSPDHSAASAPIRILVVDDHPAVREGLALLVEPEGMRLCGEAGNRTEALAVLKNCIPDLAIVDLSLDKEDGLMLVSDLKTHGVPALVYSMHGDLQHIEGALSAGALGYVTKREFRGVLVEAIKEVSSGRRFLSPRAAAALAERFSEPRGGNEAGPLSGKEKEVYRLLGKGEGTFEIASLMKISTHTVESYYARIQVKLGLQNMHELRRHAIDHFRQHSD